VRVRWLKWRREGRDAHRIGAGERGDGEDGGGKRTEERDRGSEARGRKAKEVEKERGDRCRMLVNDKREGIIGCGVARKKEIEQKGETGGGAGGWRRWRRRV